MPPPPVCLLLNCKIYLACSAMTNRKIDDICKNVGLILVKRYPTYTHPLSRNTIFQCCGYGSGIRCLFDRWIRDQGWAKNQDPDPGWTTLTIFPRALNQFFGLKYLNSLKRIRDGKNSDSGSGMEKIRIRDKHPVSATLQFSGQKTGESETDLT